MSRRIAFEIGRVYAGLTLRDDDRPVFTVASRDANTMTDTTGRRHKIVIGIGPNGEDCETVRVDERGVVAEGGVFRACAAVRTDPQP